MRKKILLVTAIAIAIVISVSTLIALFLNKGDSEPLLDVTLRTDGVLIFGGESQYYRVFENGRHKRIAEYRNSESLSYRVASDNQTGGTVLIDNVTNQKIDTGNITQYVEYAIESIAGNGSPDARIYKFYICGGNRYFFNVFDSPETSSGYSDTIYEFIPDGNQIKKLTAFKNKRIESLQIAKN